MTYSGSYDDLVLRNSASAVDVVNSNNGSSSPVHFANSYFTDLSQTPDQRYVYVADYGGTNIGYGTPSGTQYVHRYDLATGTWGIKTTPAIAYHIQAVDSDHIILAGIDQWINFSYEDWGTGPSATPLGNSGTGTGYYANVVSGDIQYDPSSGRLIHGNSGSSSQEIQAFRLTGNNFVRQEGSGTYGSASGYGGTTVLSTDYRYYYYGQIEVDALDVTHNLRVFPEKIIASTGLIAFAASGNYYDVATGVKLGSLGSSASAIALNPDGQDLWAYSASDSMLRHFAVVPEPSALSLLVLGLIGFPRRSSRRRAVGSPNSSACEGQVVGH